MSKRLTEKEIDDGLSDLVAHTVIELRNREPDVVVPLTITLMDDVTCQRMLLAAVHLLALYIERDRLASVPSN